jgi:hypothetical protein
VGGTPDVEAVRNLARMVVSQVAPEELPTFSILADVSLADPARMLDSRDDIRERLGFGVGEVVILMTPYAILAASEVVKYLAKWATEAGTTAAARFVARRGNGHQTGEPKRLDLSADQVQELRGVVREKALQFGLLPPKAELLADAFAGAVTLHDG